VNRFPGRPIGTLSDLRSLVWKTLRLKSREAAISKMTRKSNGLAALVGIW